MSGLLLQQADAAGVRADMQAQQLRRASQPRPASCLGMAGMSGMADLRAAREFADAETQTRTQVAVTVPHGVGPAASRVSAFRRSLGSDRRGVEGWKGTLDLAAVDLSRYAWSVPGDDGVGGPRHPSNHDGHWRLALAGSARVRWLGIRDEVCADETCTAGIVGYASRSGLCNLSACLSQRSGRIADANEHLDGRDDGRQQETVVTKFVDGRSTSQQHDQDVSGSIASSTAGPNRLSRGLAWSSITVGIFDLDCYIHSSRLTSTQVDGDLRSTWAAATNPRTLRNPRHPPLPAAFLYWTNIVNWFRLGISLISRCRILSWGFGIAISSLYILSRSLTVILQETIWQGVFHYFLHHTYICPGLNVVDSVSNAQLLT
nr:hypothetical protein CFP56_30127 [Quercus suber]